MRRLVHIVYRMDVGGLETVVAQLVNHLEGFEHHIIALTQCGAFTSRIQRREVTFHELGKREGKDLMVWFRLWRLLRKIKPDLVHTLNIATLEAVIPAFFAGRPATVHAEHGRDSYDPKGENRKYIALRRILSPWVDRFVCVSRDLETWLDQRVGLPRAKIRLIVNGVDLHQFQPTQATPLPHPGGLPPDAFVLGAVGRLWPIKDHLNLIRAMGILKQMDPEAFRRCRVVLIGDGPCRGEIESLAHELQLTSMLWITGWRQEIPELIQGLDLFVLPSLAEGTPLTLMEAMAMGLPVVASRVGGVVDVVEEGVTGTLVEPGDPHALALAILKGLTQRSSTQQQGRAGRKRMEQHYALEGMVEKYRVCFQNLLLQKTK